MPRTSRLSTASAVCLLATCIAACGSATPGSGSPGSGSPGTGPSFTTLTADAYKQSACMRSHGVPNFPDPTVDSSNGRQIIAISAAGLNRAAPAFRSAQRACAKYMPAPGPNRSQGESAAQQRAHLQGELAFIGCLRTHGFPSFPDPDAQGELNLNAVAAAGINLHQPGVLKAGDACVASSHGAVTRAAVARAVSGDDQPEHQAAAAPGQ